jgi:hypothetical protein
MYSHQIVSPASAVEPVRPRVQKPVWLRPPSVLAALAVLILAGAVVLALTLSGTSRIHTAFHKAPPVTHPASAVSASTAPKGYVLDRFDHQLIPVQTSTATSPTAAKGYVLDRFDREAIPVQSSAASAQAAPRFTPPLVPKGYVRATDTHQLIPIH